MINKPNEKGQALIVVALAAMVLFGFAALAIDGSAAFSDKRHAQNAADTAVMAAALTYAHGNTDMVTVAQNRATSNGYNGSGKNTVTVTVTDTAPGVCPVLTKGKEIKVDIVSYIDTSLARVIGQNQLINKVSATSRTCLSYIGKAGTAGCRNFVDELVLTNDARQGSVNVGNDIHLDLLTLCQYRTYTWSSICHCYSDGIFS